MIVYKSWIDRTKKRKWHEEHHIRMEGWFLFGFIPLYIKDAETMRDR